MSGSVVRSGRSVILYDDELTGGTPSDTLFDAEAWSGAPTADGVSGGRGTTRYIRHRGQDWVLRHYHRGGLIGRLFEDGFVWLGEQRTRCFREWHLLDELRRRGLPVPRPVAARYSRQGLIYRQDLVSLRIPDAEPLSTRLVREGGEERLWRAVGELVGRFHAHGVWHADLTAHNLQIDRADRIWLLDFDRGRFRGPGAAWRRRNLARLRRSLAKISRSSPAGFGERQWRWLMEGYGEAPAAGIRRKDQAAAKADL